MLDFILKIVLFSTLLCFFSCEQEASKVVFKNIKKISEDEKDYITTINTAKLMSNGDLYFSDRKSTFYRIAYQDSILKPIYKIDSQEVIRQYQIIRSFNNELPFLYEANELNKKNHTSRIEYFQVDEDNIHVSLLFQFYLEEKFEKYTLHTFSFFTTVITIDTEGHLIDQLFLREAYDSNYDIFDTSFRTPPDSLHCIAPSDGFFINSDDFMFVKNNNIVRDDVPILFKFPLLKIKEGELIKKSQMNEFLMDIFPLPELYLDKKLIFSKFYFSKSPDQTLFFTDGKRIINLITNQKYLLINNKFEYIENFSFVDENTLLFTIKSDTSLHRSLCSYTIKNKEKNILLAPSSNVMCYALNRNRIIGIINENDNYFTYEYAYK